MVNRALLGHRDRLVTPERMVNPACLLPTVDPDSLDLRALPVMPANQEVMDLMVRMDNPVPLDKLTHPLLGPKARPAQPVALVRPANPVVVLVPVLPVQSVQWALEVIPAQTVNRAPAVSPARMANKVTMPNTAHVHRVPDPVAMPPLQLLDMEMRLPQVATVVPLLWLVPASRLVVVWLP